MRSRDAHPPLPSHNFRAALACSLVLLAVSLQVLGCGDSGPFTRLEDGGGDGSAPLDATTPVDAERPDLPPPVPPDVHVLITADNAYGFGYGDVDGMVHYFMGFEATEAGQIFNCSRACGASSPCPAGACDIFGTCNDDRLGPETYVVPAAMAPQDGFLYIAAWSDEQVTQGLIAQFWASDGSGTPVYTGSGAWQVCATGIDIDPNGADPTMAQINLEVARCNMGSSGPSFSGGWIGDDLGNNPSGVMELTVLRNPSAEPQSFRGLCQADDDSEPGRRGDSLDAAARWMWFDDDNTAAPTAFESNGSPRGDFLIFRLPVAAVIIFG